ncbi:MAG: sugar phosphate nucleotidyltransferase [Thermoanaerobaculia bacterium]|nr:sugar phosphate nucleotidyltransferase [Thermoanaerobaculia bacterium]
MKVLVLCGGQGSRLGPVAGDLPKPMVPIGGRPILWHILSGFAHWGFRDFGLLLGFRSDLVKQYFLNLPVMLGDVTIDYARGGAPTVAEAALPDWRITLLETGLDNQTGNRVKQGSRCLDATDDLFAVTYGDGVTDLDFRRVVAFHRAHGKLATVTAVHPPGRFGELGLGDDGLVREFNEKPQAATGWISGGYFVFSRAGRARFSDDPALVLEEEPLRGLARDGELVAYRHEGFWYCVDTPRDYQALNSMWAGGRAPWAVWREGR